MEKPVLKKRRGISPIWILPIVALMIGGWLLYQSYRDVGIDVIVHFDSAEGITIGKTKVFYKGIPVGVVRGIKAGLVTDITFDEEKEIITAHINIDPGAEAILREGTRFWVVKPEISINRIRHLDTIVKGVYIAFKPGKVLPSGKSKKSISRRLWMRFFAKP